MKLQEISNIYFEIVIAHSKDVKTFFTQIFKQNFVACLDNS